MPPRYQSTLLSFEEKARNLFDHFGQPAHRGHARVSGGFGRSMSGLAQSLITNTGPEAAAAASGQLLVLSATGNSIASGGDYVTFDTEVYRRGFDDAAAGDGQTVPWPLSAVGEIQVEIAWDSYDGGGTVEIEVDGVVPAFGRFGSSTSGRVGWRRRGVDIDAGAAVRVKVTQTSAAAQTADVSVEFLIPGPTDDEGRWDRVLTADVYDLTHLGGQWWTTEGHSGLTVSERDPDGTEASSFEATAVDVGFHRVRGIDTDGTNLWIVGESNTVVAKYSPAGSLLSSFNPSWSGETGMSGIVVADDGTLWIVGSATRTLRHYSTTGTLLASVALPTGVQYWGAGYRDGVVFIVDATNAQLLRYDTTEERFTASVDVSAATAAPNGAWVSPTGRLYVSEDANGVWLRARSV